MAKIIRKTFSDYMATEVSKANLRPSEGRNWDDGVSGYEAKKRAEQGDPGLMPAFQALADKIDSAYGPRETNAWIASAAGSRVNVGEYLAGCPTHMRRRVKREGEGLRVAIYVSNVCSAGVPAEIMLKRGTAVVGLLTALQQRNVGVDAYVLCDTQCYSDGERDLLQCVAIDSRPLDLSVSGFVLAHVAWTRNVMYRVAENYGFHGSWAPTADNLGPDSPEYVRWLQTQLAQPGEQAIVIPPVHLRESEEAKDPEGWIRRKLDEVFQARN